MKYLALFATLVISAGVVACKKPAAPASTTTAPVVAITISPTATQTVVVGSKNNTTVPFTATVTNTTNTAVTWEVDGTTGGSITTGTISTTGLYTAPTSLINPINVTVTAVSAADTTKMASTTVAVTLPPPVAIAPTTATVAAGAGQNFTVTTSPAGLAVTWAVNGVPGGNGVVGTIAPTSASDARYTAPQVPFPGGPVFVEAFLQSDNTKFAVAPTVLTYSNFSLQGTYAFLLRGSDPSGLLLRAGSMTADGNGNITAGIEDINNGINLVQTAVSFTGTYTIGADGRGSITFNDGFNGNTAGGGNSSTFSVVIVSTHQAQMEELNTFAAASGEADLQDTTSFKNSAFSGKYTFDFSGVDAANKPISSVGELFADGVGGGTAQPAQEDVNDNGTLTSIPSTPIFSFQSVGANSRGLATLNGASYSFYMISASRAQFIAIGNPASAVTAGVATVQNGPGPLGGNFALITNGASTTGPISTAATFFLQANPNQITAGVLHQNNSGSVTVANFSGTFTVAASGRGTATLSTGQTYVFYLIAVNQAVIQQTDNSIVADGTLAGLAGGPFSTSNLANGYALQLTGVKPGGGEQDTLGEINLTNGQVATGTVDVNTATNAGLTAFTPAPGVAVPAGTTYAIANGQGPFNITVAGTNLQFQAYFLSSSSLFLLRTDMTDTRVLHGNLFQNVSLSPAIVSPTSATFTEAVAGTFTVLATGNPAATLSETGALPSGVTFNAQTGVLSGTPAAGTGGTVNTNYPIQFTATNGAGSNAVQNFTLTVRAPATN